ncbi:hypothetical protein VP150E351_P0050 [Vibrio phage 150E35-1]|nr:hypothetical protein VP150E351_P0050 [Vibrio phage 150E35-1]
MLVLQYLIMTDRVLLLWEYCTRYIQLQESFR